MNPWLNFTAHCNKLLKSLKSKANSVIFIASIVFSLLLFLIPFYVSTPSESVNSILSVSFSAVSTLLTAATFALAYLLYDMLSLDKRIMDKQADAVIQLIDFLKGRVFSANSGGYVYYIRPAIHQINELDRIPRYHIDAEKSILANPEDYDKFAQQLLPLIRSYWMPNEIKEKLNFLEFWGYYKIAGITEENLADKYIVIGFNYDATGEVCVMGPETTLKSFISNLKILTQAVEQWLQDRSSIPLELRMWERN